MSRRKRSESHGYVCEIRPRGDTYAVIVLQVKGKYPA
jgi:hypothetical protein